MDLREVQGAVAWQDVTEPKRTVAALPESVYRSISCVLYAFQARPRAVELRGPRRSPQASGAGPTATKRNGQAPGPRVETAREQSGSVLRDARVDLVAHAIRPPCMEHTFVKPWPMK